MAKAKDPKKTAAPAAPPAPARRRHDWEAIERDYRTGHFTFRELQAKHGAGYSDIAKRAKEKGWKKDLRDEVKRATADALRVHQLAAEATEAQQESQQCDSAVVEATAELNKRVILGHRAKARTAGELAVKLMAELESSTQLAEHADALVQILAGEDGDAIDLKAARGVVERALSLGGRASTFKQLCDGLRIVVGIERQAFGLDEPEEKPRPTPPAPGTIPPGAEVDAYRAWVHG